jgi:hypothetical protein
MAVDAFDYCRMTKGVFTRNEQSNIGFNRYFKRGGRSRLFMVSGEARRRVYDPPFVPTPSERSFVQTMAGARMSADEICKVIGSARGNGRPIAKTTLYRHFGNEMKKGQAMLKAVITKPGRRRRNPPVPQKSNYAQCDTERSGGFFSSATIELFLPEQPPIRPTWKSTKSFGHYGRSTPVTRVRH